ncbi:MAG: hypothetical protein EOM54_07890 [Clostridia bacterium]|nr:hypothetical protein [Clostridia bacterium]
MGNDILRDAPLGLGMALAQNERALTAFSAMSDAGKKRVIEGAHNVNSKTEMQAYVDRLGR